MKSERIFSYGTLQLEKVQMETFGRRLEGFPDVLVGYQVAKVTLSDKEVIRKSGTAVHPILKSGNWAWIYAAAEEHRL